MSDVTQSSRFRVPVRDLPASRTVEVGPDYVAATLTGLPMRDALGADGDGGRGRLDIELYPEGDNVHGRGRMRGEVVVACSRCVGPARVELDEPIHVTFMSAADLAVIHAERAAAASDEGVELGEQDLDVYPYDGETLDLEPLVREQLILAVPYAPLCREDCQGLCPQCGVDRNVEACACDKPLDPRFAALKGLKLPS
jgi:uncharacterized metal-binding protein YceD (DUF177 family)